MNPGRNDPCPCGSGRKYKHCCPAAAARAEESPGELTRARVRRAFEGHVATMLRFIRDAYGEEALDEAWREFICWDDEQALYDPDSPHVPLFLPWFFHSWAPDPLDTSVEDASLHDRSPTRVFLERRGTRIDPTLRRYLEACRDTPFCFHEITACEPGRGFTARDLLTEEIVDVIEQSGSRMMRPGDILFAQIVRIDGIALLEGCPPCGLPPDSALDILDAREKMRKAMGRLTADVVRDYDIELREIYLDLIEDTLNPPTPELRNTDGDPILWHRLSFDIDSAEPAFQALKHLSLGESDQQLLVDAKRNRAGELQAVSFDWRKAGNQMHASWDNTVLGHVEIRGHRLTCEVNSEKRAAAFRKIVERALGAAARIRPTEITPLEANLAQMQGQKRGRGAGASRGEASRSEHDRLMELPEVREHLRGMLAAHYEKWVDDKLPALGNRTPRQAVRTKAGREKVAALVRQIEYDGPRMSPPLDPAIVSKLRSELGLE